MPATPSSRGTYRRRFISPRATRWLAGIGIVVLALAAGVSFFDWNVLRAPIERRVEQATGRTFKINGDLHVHLSLKPRISAEGLVLGNASWARDPNMAEIGRLEFTVDAPALLKHRAVFDRVALSDARISLERNADGMANWQFGAKEDESAPPGIGSLTIDHGVVAFRDPAIKTDVTAQVSTVPAEERDAGMLKVSARGRLKGMTGVLDGVVGSFLALTAADKPYPIRLQATLGTTKARVDGVLIDPLKLRGEDLSFELAGSDLGYLFPIVGVPLPPTPPYRLSGHLNHSGAMWTFRKFAGHVGDSDLAGDFSVDVGPSPQNIKADLVSHRLDMKDLGGFIGADRGQAKTSPKPPPAGRVLPQETFNLEKLRAANADVKFRGERVLTEKLPLENMVATLKLRDGVLSFEPLDFGVAGGTLDSQIRMDARESVIRTKADVAVKRLQLEKLFPDFKLSRANAGLISGRIRLQSTGNSVATMLGRGDGDAALLMEGGSVSELLVRMLNLDVANAIPVLLTGDRQLPVRCMVAQLEGEQGQFKTRTLLLDTGKAIVTGSGAVDFAEEALDLRLVSKSKDFSLAALRGPIHISGTLKSPRVSPDLPKLIGRGGIAAALGIATGGLGALLALVDPGGAEDSHCAELVQAAQTFASQPAPGKK